MSRLRSAFREALMIVFAAAALGFIYTAATEKGIFANATGATGRAANTGPNAPMVISSEEAKKFFEESGALFVDARHEFDFKLGHIKGAINIPLKDFDAHKEIIASIPKDKLIVVYCDGAECNSSIELAAKLHTLGFTNIKIFFGGWREWEAHHLPTEAAPQ